LAAHGVAVSVVAKPGIDASTIILTEGLSAGTPVTRHWAALAKARHGHKTADTMIFLQASARPPYDRVSGLTGLSRTLRKEWDTETCMTWTFAETRPEPLAELVCQSLTAITTDALIAADASYQISQTGTAIAPPPRPVKAAPAIWLITGGARGVTASCAIELANRAGGGRFILAGRSAQTPWPSGVAVTDDLNTLRGALARKARAEATKTTPAAINQQARRALAGREITNTLAAISAAGGRAYYRQLDIENTAGVRAAIAEIEATHGAITGLVHGAGVLADRLAVDKTKAELKAVFGPKVTGLLNLLDCLDLPRLRHIGLFSSASALFGNIGQSDYAMANQILNQIAISLARDHPEAQVKSFNWGPWDGGMVDAGLAAHFAAQGITLINRADGARIFADQLLHGDRAQVELLVGDQWTPA